MPSSRGAAASTSIRWYCRGDARGRGRRGRERRAGRRARGGARARATKRSGRATGSTTTSCASRRPRTPRATTRRSCASICCSTTRARGRRARSTRTAREVTTRRSASRGSRAPRGSSPATIRRTSSRGSSHACARWPTAERSGILHATGYAEDLQVCALVARELERAGTRAILAPPTAPRLRGGDLASTAEPVRALYRYFPTEWMSGQRNVAGHRARHRVRPRSDADEPRAHLHAVQARLRARVGAGAGRARSRDARRARRRCGATSSRERAAWVVKRSMGRVGDEVFVGALYRDDDWAAAVDDARACAREGTALDRPALRRASVRVPTPWGDRLVTLGAYVRTAASPATSRASPRTATSRTTRSASRSSPGSA